MDPITRTKPSEGDQYKRTDSDDTVYTVHECVDTGVLLTDDNHRTMYIAWSDFMSDYRPLTKEEPGRRNAAPVNAFDWYQQQAAKTAIYPVESKVMYSVLGLVGEAGEVAGKLSKLIRDNDSNVTPEFIASMSKELGDTLWFLAAVCTDMGLSLRDVAQQNLDKLANRAKANTLKGSGDNR